MASLTAMGVCYGLPAGATPKLRRAHAVGRDRLTMSGVPRLYKSLRVKAVAHVLADVF